MVQLEKIVFTRDGKFHKVIHGTIVYIEVNISLYPVEFTRIGMLP